MQFLHRDAMPRWARGVTSPWLISPLLVVALAIGGFTAYGAWTRAHPTHYARGGDSFGVDSLLPSPDASAASGEGKRKGTKPPAGAPGKKAARTKRASAKNAGAGRATRAGRGGGAGGALGRRPRARAAPHAPAGGGAQRPVAAPGVAARPAAPRRRPAPPAGCCGGRARTRSPSMAART